MHEWIKINDRSSTTALTLIQIKFVDSETHCASCNRNALYLLSYCDINALLGTDRSDLKPKHIP